MSSAAAPPAGTGPGTRGKPTSTSMPCMAKLTSPLAAQATSPLRSPRLCSGYGSASSVCVKRQHCSLPFRRPRTQPAVRALPLRCPTRPSRRWTAARPTLLARATRRCRGTMPSMLPKLLKHKQGRGMRSQQAQRRTRRRRRRRRKQWREPRDSLKPEEPTSERRFPRTMGSRTNSRPSRRQRK